MGSREALPSGVYVESPAESKTAFKAHLDAMRDSEAFGNEHFQTLLDENQAGVVALESWSPLLPLMHT